jgi:hypothetical protein
MKNPLSIALAAILFCSCSSTNLVTMSVLKPAPVTLPQHIKNVGIINRSLASEKTKVVDAIDKVFSMEGKNLDKDGAQASITGLTDELMKNNRFTEVKMLASTDVRTTTPGMFPSSMSWDTVIKICKDNNMDALFALELFDTDSRISYMTSPTSIKTPLGNVPAIEHKANMLTMVRTGWRIYDPVGKNILDEFAVSNDITYSAKGINPVVAAGALIDRKDAVKEVGNKTGQSYAWRIIPYWVRVSRDYYVKGTDNFVMAKRKAQTGNWDGAAALWEKETNNPNRKIAGRACYNMAIINEINGQLEKAIGWAQKAYEDYENPLALRYVRILERRRANDEILANQ